MQSDKTAFPATNRHGKGNTSSCGARSMPENTQCFSPESAQRDTAPQGISSCVCVCVKCAFSFLSSLHDLAMKMQSVSSLTQSVSLLCLP